MQALSANNKQIAKNTIYLYIRLIFSVLVGLITSRVVLQTLGVENYGIYNLVGGFVSLLSVFTFSIGGTCQRFIVYELGRNDKNKLSDMFCTISVMLLVFSAIFLIFASVFGIWIIDTYLNIPKERISAANIVYICSLCTFCFQLIAIPYTSLVIAHEKMDFYAIMSIFESVAKLVIALAISYVSWDKLVYYALSLALMSLSVRIIYSFYCNKKFEESKFHWIFKKDVFKEIVTFTFWVSIGSFAGILKDQGGAIIINLFFGVVLNAACGIANQVRGVINQLSSSLGLAISPQITKSYSSGQVDRSIRLTFLLAKAQTLMMLLVALPIFFETPRLLNLWLGEVPDYTIVFVRAILLLSIAQALETSHGPLFLAIGRVKKFEVVVSVFTLLVLPLTYVCYKLELHPVSYYIVCIFFEIILFFYCYSFLIKAASFPFGDFFKEIVLRIIVAVVITVILQKLFNVITITISSNIAQMIANMISCVIGFMISAYIIVINKEEKVLLKNYIISKISHKRNETWNL